MLGIADYEPDWIDSSAELLASHADRLSSLRGLTLTRHWVVQDRGGGEWFTDTPIVLVFGDEHLEIACWKLDQLAITWGQIDLARPLDWYGTELDLQWRADWLPVPNQALGRAVSDVWVTEHLFKTRLGHGEGAPESATWLLSGLEFGFGSSKLQVFNSLDEVGIEYGDPVDEDWLRRIEITP